MAGVMMVHGVYTLTVTSLTVMLVTVTTVVTQMTVLVMMAEEEFAWCDAEMLLASREVG